MPKQVSAEANMHGEPIPIARRPLGSGPSTGRFVSTPGTEFDRPSSRRARAELHEVIEGKAQANPQELHQ